MTAEEPVLDVRLQELLDQQSFGEVAESFARLFGIAIRLFDTEGNLLVVAERENTACGYLRSFEKTRDRCTVIRSRLKAFPAQADSGTQIVHCFCGSAYAVTPIVFQTDALGKIVVGPYLPHELERIPQTVVELAPEIDVPRLRDEYAEMRRLSSETVDGLSESVASVVAALIFFAHREQVTYRMHIAAVREAFREMTEKNRQLAAMVEARREFDRVKSNFLAMISHELRTPLTSIIGYSDMLIEGIAGQLGAEQKQFAETIKSKGDELLKLISSILDFTQIDSGRASVDRIEVDPRSIVADALARSKELAERRGVRLSSDLSPNLRPARLDPEKILAAVSHLVDNAVKFSPPGGIVKLSARISAAEESDGPDDGLGFVLMATVDSLEISVEDFGMGISEGEVDAIFAPFRQIDGSSTREHGGAGLGLAIVKHYVEAHGGRVLVRSRPGEGSTFTIRLPLVDLG